VTLRIRDIPFRKVQYRLLEKEYRKLRSDLVCTVWEIFEDCCVISVTIDRVNFKVSFFSFGDVIDSLLEERAH